MKAVERCSHATKYLYLWVRAMLNFNKVWVETEPARVTLR